MLRVKHLIFILISVAVCGTAAARSHGFMHQRLEPETLQYRVMFKWGLINKKAGTATLSLTHDAKRYNACMSAKSEPWPTVYSEYAIP